MVFVYSAAHFLVDFACAFLMFRDVAPMPDWELCVMIYNFCAFAVQMPLGILADLWSKNSFLAAAGCAFVGAAYGIRGVPVAAAVVAGLGNALFHIGGGVDVLNISEEKSGALGVFVSPGAWGIYFGAALGRGSSQPPIQIPAALFASAAVIFVLFGKMRGVCPKNAPFSLDSGTSPRALFAAVCLFLVVCLRSYAGLALDFPWKNVDGLGIVLICAVVLGKTAGGFAGDRFGMMRTTFFSLGGAAVLFLFSQTPFFGVAAVLLFNMTMPVTLWAMAKIFPEAKGFSFGLLTFGLFLGFLPVYFGFVPASGALWPFAAAAAVSLALLGAGLRKANV